LWLIAPRLLPDRPAPFQGTSLRIFEAQLHLPEQSFLNGRTIADARKLTNGDMVVQSVLRPPGLRIAPLPDVVLRGGDQLVVSDPSERLMEYARVLGAKLYSGDTQIDEEHPLTAPDQQIAELVLTPTSPLRDRTLAQANFDWQYQLIPLAIHRPGESDALASATTLRDVPLGAGDVLLVPGPAEQVQALKRP